MVTSVGSSYCYWDLSTRIDYKNLPLSKKFFGVEKMKFCGVNIMFDNKPKVTKRHITFMYALHFILTLI